MRTQKGNELARKLRPRDNPHLYIDVDICSALCRAATSYARIQEDACNGHPINSSPTAPIDYIHKLQGKWEARCDRENDRLEALIKRHAESLPGVKAVLFGGDPRGCTVTLVMTDGRSDDWGREGLTVPGS